MRVLNAYLSSSWNCEVRGAIYASDNPGDLGEDMLEIALPNGLLVTAGWYPEADPAGEYIVTLTSGLKHVLEPFSTKDAGEALQEAVSMASSFHYRRFSGTNDTTTSQSIHGIC